MENSMDKLSDFIYVSSPWVWFVYVYENASRNNEKRRDSEAVVKVITLFVIYRGDQFYLKRISSLFICRFRKWNLRRFKFVGFHFLFLSDAIALETPTTKFYAR